MSSIIDKLTKLQHRINEDPEKFYEATNYYTDIGISEDQVKAFRDLEENVIDKLHFIFAKKARERLGKSYGISSTELFTEVVLSEEGKDLLRILEEHISSECMVLYMLDKLFKIFDHEMRKMSTPIDECEECDDREECDEYDSE